MVLLKILDRLLKLTVKYVLKYVFIFDERISMLTKNNINDERDRISK